MLEIFCGTAGLSAALKRLGFDVIAVDKIVAKAPKVMVTKLDLTQFSTQQLVFDWIRMPQVKAVFLAPPCGTASLARNIQFEDMPDMPQPLRSLEQPDGLDDLSDIDFLRVGQANILYDFSAACYDLCCQLDKLFLCENPKDSLYWATTPWTDREHVEMEVEQVHQACAYGALRPKWTKLVGNFEEIYQINKVCPGDHQHAPWGVLQRGQRRVFATSLEVHYPPALCDAIANVIALGLKSKGITPTVAPLINPAARAFSNLQPATNKLATFIPEYKAKFLTISLDDVQIWPKTPVATSSTKLLHDFDVGGDNMEQLICRLHDQCAVKALDVVFDASQFSMVTFPCMLSLRCFGVHWSEQEFVEKALQAEHPLNAQDAVPKELIEAMHFNLKNDAHYIISHRAQFLSKWLQRAKELSPFEDKLKESMDVDVAAAVKNKRILLFEEMLRDTEYPDVGVVDELRLGADLVGCVPATNMLPGKFVPAVSSVSELEHKATLVRPMLDAECRGSGDETIDATVWQKTLDEVEMGWLRGPLQKCEVPFNHPISRRFGLLQKKGKVRLIDDYSESGVNSCVTTVEAPVLHTADIASASLVLWFNMCGAWGADPKLVVRTFDLTSAYRQVALSPNGKRFACIRVFDPANQCMRYFRSCVLPFGATRSVHSFLRLARAIWWLGVVGCRLIWTSFYDDFISYSQFMLAKSTEGTISALFKILGWVFAESGDKCMPFSDMCDALGVSFDLSMSFKGFATVCNTASRVTELCADMQLVIESGVLSSKDAQRLRGRMQFADAQLFGRTGKRCLRMLGDFAENRRRNLTDKDVFFLRLFMVLLQKNIPRELRSLGTSNTVICTDACYEKEKHEWSCGIGGVLCTCEAVSLFSLQLDERVRSILGEGNKKQIIFEAETLAAVVAFALWRRDFVNRRCLLFVDNEATKYSLLKGISDNPTVDALAECFAELESEVHAFAWLARVPSKSNVADPPSRGNLGHAIFQTALNVSTDAIPILNDLTTQLTRMGERGCVFSHRAKRRDISA